MDGNADILEDIHGTMDVRVELSVVTDIHGARTVRPGECVKDKQKAEVSAEKEKPSEKKKSDWWVSE